MEMQKYKDQIEKVYTADKNSSTMISSQNDDLRNSIMKRFQFEADVRKKLPEFLRKEKKRIFAEK